jgi:Tfp pilus assembly protein PilX
MSEIVEKLRTRAAETDDRRAEVALRKAAARIEQLEAALKMFACACADEHLCSVPENCRNYLARTTLEAKPAGEQGHE